MVQAARLSAGCLEGIDSIEAWHSKRPQYREALAWMLGLSPMPPRTANFAVVKGVLEKEFYTIQKLVFQSIPGLYVTANFYLPRQHSTPMPCVMNLYGHWPSLQGSKTGLQERYLWYPANGFALLVVDPLEFGEIQGIHHGTNNLNLWNWMSLGYTPAGVEVWNAMRALDWLEARPEVDAQRVGVIGVSGGGVMTQYLAALDERVAVAAPSCSTYTVGSQVAKGLVPEQCDCTYYPNVFRMDFPEVLALMAPRPLLILGGRKDPIFPPDGFRDAFRSADRIYDLYGVQLGDSPRFRLVESGAGHTDTPHLLLETRRWMARWLREEDRVPERAFGSDQPSPEPAEALACLTELPPSALNPHVHRVWIQAPENRPPASLKEWENRREVLLHILKKRIFGWFPEQPPLPRCRGVRNSGGFVGELAHFGEYEVETEPNVWVKIELIAPRSRSHGTPLLVWIRRPEDHVSFPDVDEILPLLSSHAIGVVTPRFSDNPLSGAAFARVERTAALLGRTVAAMQVWDVLQSVAWIMAKYKEATPTSITLFGRGVAGITAIYAGIMEDKVVQVVMDDPPSTHRTGPALLTILRDTDLPEISALFAPRRLTFLGETSRDFEWTRAVYCLGGWAEGLSSKPSLTSALAPGEEPFIMK